MPSAPKAKSPQATKPAKPASPQTSQTISVADAKAHFSSLISGVQKKRNSVTILKRGIPVAEIVPFREGAATSGFGWMRGTVQVLGDIVGPTGIEWNLKELEEEHE